MREPQGARLRLRLAALAFFLLAACAGPRAVFTPGPGEPAWCDPAFLRAHEVAEPEGGRSGLWRLHAFRLGRVLLAGLAIGYSDTVAVRALAERHSAGAGEGYCTWYLNRGNAEAARTFVFRPLPFPGGAGAPSDAAVYLDVLGGSFFSEPVSFLSCAADHGYLALGCDGMLHRGPTAFGMLLAFSGCAPEHAAAIVNEAWGLNGVPAEARLEIIRAAYDFGRAHPAESSRLREAFAQ